MKLVTTVKILSKAAQMAVHWPRSSSHCRSLLFLPPRHLHLLFACDRISLCKTALSSQPDPYSSQVLVFSKHSNVAPHLSIQVLLSGLVSVLGWTCCFLTPAYFPVSSRIFSQSFSSTIYIFDSISYQNSLPLEDVFLAIFLQFSPLFFLCCICIF